MARGPREGREWCDGGTWRFAPRRYLQRLSVPIAHRLARPVARVLAWTTDGTDLTIGGPLPVADLRYL